MSDARQPASAPCPAGSLKRSTSWLRHPSVVRFFKEKPRQMALAKAWTAHARKSCPQLVLSPAWKLSEDEEEPLPEFMVLVLQGRAVFWKSGDGKARIKLDPKCDPWEWRQYCHPDLFL